MPGSDKSLSYDELLRETIALRQQIVDLKANEADLELIQEVTTEHSDDVLADLHRKNLLIRKIFGRYLTEEVVTTLLEQPTALELGGKRQIVSVLVADLRGFTALSENLSAEDVIKVLNWFLGQMTDVITQYDGTINDFTGDGIMVLFGAPTVRDDDAQRAVSCAVAMQLAMATVNQRMEQWQLPKLQMGIGINTGDAVVGNIGSEKHTKYSAIGKQVNLAYRIESYTVGGQVLISEQTLKKSSSIINIANKKQVYPKGLSQPITVFEVRGMGDRQEFLLPEQEETLYALQPALTVKYAILDGKQIGNRVFHAHLIKLSKQGAELRLPSPNPSSTHESSEHDNNGSQASKLLMSDLKLNIWQSDRPHKPQESVASENSDNIVSSEGSKNSGSYSGDIYAKVMNHDSQDNTIVIHFTSLHPDETTYLNQLYQSLQSRPKD